MEWIINNSKFSHLKNMPQVNEYEGRKIDLITVVELHRIQVTSPNVLLINIFGDIKEAKDANDDDRSGYSAFAILNKVR